MAGAAAIAALGTLGRRVEDALKELDTGNVIERIWRGDHTVWSQDPTEITQPSRLGWLTVAGDMMKEAPQLRRFAEDVVAEGYTTAVLFGMGGSSLAPEVLQATFGARLGMLRLHVLDSTHPDSVLDLQDSLDLPHTLFVVSSKSGTTIETLSHFEYFWNLVPDGSHFIAVTDPGSPLQYLGEERGFRRVFLNPVDIGGRYSALSYFGLVPGALVGVDLDALLKAAQTMAAACRAASASDNPGAYLGAIMGEAALAGRDKLTLLLPDEFASFGDWVEQLLAESTGKEGKGILPVAGETPASADAYGDDRLFVALGDQPGLAELEAAGHPVVRLPYDGPQQLGSEFFRWEFATAVAGQRLQLNPFDQPDVQAAKDATSAILASGQTGSETLSLDDVLSVVKPGGYLAINAFLPRSQATQSALQGLRLALAKRYRVATTLGFGPRYLHSTGQLHKGGPDGGVFLLLTDDATRDAGIPGRPFSFDRLRRAQALGDLKSLQARGRRVAHVHLIGERIKAIKELTQRLGQRGARG